MRDRKLLVAVHVHADGARLSFLCGSELNTRDIERTEVAEIRFLRSVAGYSLKDQEWDPKIRQELKIMCLNQEIKQRRLEWLQSVQRIDADWLVITKKSDRISPRKEGGVLVAQLTVGKMN
jgi:hypothetical protein